MTGEYHLASCVEPHWHVKVDDDWVWVGMVVETETPDGGGRLRFVFDDGTYVEADKGNLVMSRPPDNGSPTCRCGGVSDVD